MRGRAVVILVVLSALALLASSAQAAVPRTVATCGGARFDKAAGVARSLSDCGRVDMARGPEGAARQALGRLAGALGVRRDTGDLTLMRVSKTSAGPRVRFQQYVGGVPVRNGQVAVALGNDGSVTYVGNGAAAATTLDMKPRVDRAAALLTARRRVPSGFDLVAAPATFSRRSTRSSTTPAPPRPTPPTPSSRRGTRACATVPIPRSPMTQATTRIQPR